jgi:hypothetical protein
MRSLIGTWVMVVMQQVCTGRHFGVAQDDGGTSIDDTQHETHGNEGANE